MQGLAGVSFSTKSPAQVASLPHHKTDSEENTTPEDDVDSPDSAEERGAAISGKLLASCVDAVALLPAVAFILLHPTDTPSFEAFVNRGPEGV